LIDCLRPESTQPNLVKAPSDTLFAFDELAFDFTFDSIQPDAKFLFAQLTRFKIQANSVSFSDNSLMRIINQFKSVSTSTESNIFEKEDLHLYWCAFKGATCENNQITQLSLCNTNFRFYGQWPNLKKLSLFLFPTFKSDWNLFKSFPNLEKLVIKNTESYDISQYDLLSCFAHGESLKRLAIRANTVGCIEKLAHCFPQLEELDLSGSSNLHTIGPNAFLNFPHLKKLNLSNCSIRNVDRGAFSHLLNLDELDLSFNTDLTTLQMNGPVVPSVLKAICCLKLAKVKLLNSPSSSVIDKLLFPFTGFQMTLEGPSHLFVNTKMLEISLTYGMSFDLFSALEELTLRIANFGDVKRGQLANLICLKKLQFECESKLDSLYGLFFYFFLMLTGCN
jgi:Leucine-rich repeat (LRR) protein